MWAVRPPIQAGEEASKPARSWRRGLEGEAQGGDTHLRRRTDRRMDRRKREEVLRQHRAGRRRKKAVTDPCAKAMASARTLGENLSGVGAGESTAQC